MLSTFPNPGCEQERMIPVPAGAPVLGWRGWWVCVCAQRGGLEPLPGRPPAQEGQESVFLTYLQRAGPVRVNELSAKANCVLMEG